MYIKFWPFKLSSNANDIENENKFEKHRKGFILLCNKYIT